MNNFALANQARLSLKMQLSHYHWYAGSSVENDKESYVVVIYLADINDGIRKIIPTVHQEIEVKVDVRTSHKKQRQG